MSQANRERLRLVAEALGDLRTRVVFVGGAVVELYATDPAAPEPRPTLDVDCIIEVSTRLAYSKLEEDLRRKGFRNDQREGAPVCRWLVKDIKVDVMPLQPDILGFSNEWYQEGFRHIHIVSLGAGVMVNLLDTPYFLATKVAALYNRGLGDLRTSSDFEDIVYILSNRGSVLDEVKAAEGKVRQYLSASFKELLSSSMVDEAIDAALGYGEPAGARARVRASFEQMSASGNS
jgi:predicted nucleotidyltransferase